MSKNTKTISTFVDHIGRVILGEVVSDSKETLKVKNPAIIHIGQQPQTGQLQVQTIPFFFREFVSSKAQKEGTVWSFNKDSVVVGEVDLDERLIEQYERIFTNNPLPQAPQVNPVGKQSANNKAEIIKLFDDEE